MKIAEKLPLGSPFFSFQKHLKHKFNQAASHYDDHTHVQNKMIEVLAQTAKNLLSPHPTCAIDLGCGTSRLAKTLSSHFSKHRIITLDLAYEMLHQHDPQSSHINADFHHLPFNDHSIDYLCSSSALHWAENPKQVFNECFRVLKPHGLFLLGTFIEGTISEIQSCWSHLKQGPRTISFLSADDYQNMSHAAGLTTLHAETITFKIYFKNPKTALLSLKNIGSSQVRTHRIIMPRSLEAFENIYWKIYGFQQEVPLTYQVLFLALQKSVSL